MSSPRVYEARRARGECGACGSPSERATCEACCARLAEDRRARAAARVCTRCGARDAEAGRAYCARCLVWMRARSIARHASSGGNVGVHRCGVCGGRGHNRRSHEAAEVAS